MLVYKKEEIPAHLHYRHNIRIMPIIVEAKEGWTIMQNRSGSFMCTFLSLLKLCRDSVLICGLNIFSTFQTAAFICTINILIGFFFLLIELACVVPAVINKDS